MIIAVTRKGLMQALKSASPSGDVTKKLVDAGALIVRVTAADGHWAVAAIAMAVKKCP